MNKLLFIVIAIVIVFSAVAPAQSEIIVAACRGKHISDIGGPFGRPVSQRNPSNLQQRHDDRTNVVVCNCYKGIISYD